MYMYLLLYTLIPSDKKYEVMYENNNRYYQFSVMTLFNLGFRPRLKRVFTEYRDHTCFFHALTFARFRGSCFNTRPTGRVFEHRPCDPASVNAMKQTCVIVILTYFT